MTERGPSASERLRWLVGHARAWVLALGLLAVAVAVGVSWTLGVFESSSANPRNTVSAGSMRQVSSAEGEAVLSGDDLVPGSATSGSATITNAGDASGDFTLAGKDLVDDPGPGGGRLSAVLRLRIVESGNPDPVYAGTLADFDTEPLGTWEPDEERTYEFTVTFPVGSGDNSYQLSATSLTFVWRAVQSTD